MEAEEDDGARDTFPGPDDDADGYPWEMAIARLSAAVDDLGAEVAALKRQSDRPVPLLAAHAGVAAKEAIAPVAVKVRGHRAGVDGDRELLGDRAGQGVRSARRARAVDHHLRARGLVEGADGGGVLPACGPAARGGPEDEEAGHLTDANP